MKYQIQITETFATTFDVEADTAQEAERMAHDMADAHQVPEYSKVERNVLVEEKK